MFRRRIPFSQMAFVTLLGVCGGIYIYKPYFEQHTAGQQKQHVPKKDNETDNSSE
ncbi:protein PIGBOS1 [Larimichthys crocea]|uniref:protein PIGBOS1 n=1 Tax=Larimichthys crocea TaxID=215358 RepID=UPI0009018AE9|nr:protein PIGBOS1 [Larimichthys crocea]